MMVTTSTAHGSGASAALMELPAEAARILREEEELMAHVQAALAAASRTERPAVARSGALDVLRELRAEAQTASADDLPSVLHELSVRQTLRAHAPAPELPDSWQPYIAHLRVHDGKGERDYLLGHRTFLDGARGVRIVDWRVAPIAQVFYKYREGDAYEEELAGRLAEGTVRARRIVVVEGGALQRILTDAWVLTRDAQGWRADARGRHALAAGGAGTAARPGALGVGVAATDATRAPITALLDAEQFAAVTAPPEQPLLVLGSAGSGKTTVALHRLARIASVDLEHHPLASARVLVPEEGLARLSRRLLAPLDAASAQVKTLDDWAKELARQVFGKKLRLASDPPGVVTSLKRHPALYEALRARFTRLKAESTTVPRLRKRLHDAFTDRGFLASVVQAAKGTLPTAAVEETVRHTLLQMAEPLSRELASITDPRLKEAIDGRAIASGTPDELAGTFDLEDLPILLFLRAWRSSLEAPPVGHVVLDEAEDVSLFELFVTGRALGDHPSVTLAGDEAQQTASSFAGWPMALETLGVAKAATCRLAVSYRCPRPVAELARKLLGAMAPDGPVLAARDGAPVGTFQFPSEEPAFLFLADAVRDLLAREPKASVAIIAHDESTARRIHALLADVPEARLVTRGEFTFESGVDVTDVENAKGLEFDYVLVPDATAAAYPMTDEARRRLHVAVTRTSHQLWLLASGPPSPLLS